MSSEKFFQSKTALITLIAASIVVIISLGVRQTFGLFYLDFSTDLDISITHFGFAIGLQLFLWGLFGPLFGIITDKYGGNVAIFIGFLFYLAGVYLFYLGFNTGFYFTLTMGILIGVGLVSVFNFSTFLSRLGSTKGPFQTDLDITNSFFSFVI